MLHGHALVPIDSAFYRKRLTWIAKFHQQLMAKLGHQGKTIFFFLNKLNLVCYFAKLLQYSFFIITTISHLAGFTCKPRLFSSSMIFTKSENTTSLLPPSVPSSKYHILNPLLQLEITSLIASKKSSEPNRSPCCTPFFENKISVLKNKLLGLHMLDKHKSKSEEKIPKLSEACNLSLLY